MRESRDSCERLSGIKIESRDLLFTRRTPYFLVLDTLISHPTSPCDTITEPELHFQQSKQSNERMPPIALGSKHQDLLKAYLEVSKSEKPDWTSIALQADFASAKYARDQFAIVKKKFLATPYGEPTNFSDTHLTLLQTVMRVLKAEVCVVCLLAVVFMLLPMFPVVANDIFADRLGEGGSTGKVQDSKVRSRSVGYRQEQAQRRF